jgi:pimeloyl-[acyl-carrier protein] methyl ester esterase
MGQLDDMSVVLLPGMHGTGDFMTGVVAALAPHQAAHVIPYPNDRPMGYRDLTALVRSQLPDGPIVIVGESFGGPMAIEIAAYHANVRGLVLAGSFCRNPWPRGLSPFARPFGKGWLPQKALEPVLFGFDAVPELSQRLSQILATVPDSVLRKRVVEVLNVDQRATLARVACPVACLHGRSDWLVRSKYVAEVCAIKPAASVHWFDAAHVVLGTKPVESAAVIERFCAELIAV